MIDYTLTTEGTSDRVLLRHIDWLLSQHASVEFDGKWADPATFTSRERDVETRMLESIRNYPCNLLFVHRDSDGQGYAARKTEITDALGRCGLGVPVVCVIPVKMTEAWLLIEERAVRTSAGNPKGRSDIQFPRLSALEGLADPKERLNSCLMLASETTGRKRQRFSSSLGASRHRVSQLIENLDALRRVQAFVDFEGEVKRILAENGWSPE